MQKKLLTSLQVPDEVFNDALETVYEMRVRLPDNEFMARVAMMFCLSKATIEEKAEEFLSDE